MRKITILLAMLTLIASNMMAQQVSVSEAMSRAQAFLQASSPSQAKSKSAASSQVTLAYTCKDKADKNVCYYIFNGAGGFVIVGGDEAAQQILGYSDGGTFDYATAPDNFKWWLSQYQQQITSAISYAETHPSAAKSARAKAARMKAASTKTDISPLLTTTWNQKAPYNNAATNAFYTQTGVNVDLATGCVATAMSQVLYYHKDITKGSGTATGTTRGYSISNQSYSFTPQVTFLENYDWANMLTSYSGSYSEDEGNAVATLMYHAGVSVDMNYGNTSGASVSKIPYALSTYFGYDKSARYEQRNYYSDSEWEEIIYNELKNNGPVIYGGNDKNSDNGHCFVCDGYRSSDNTYHINWGWGGAYDCYCTLSGKSGVLAPGGTGTGGAGTDAEYSEDQEAVINVKANANGLEAPVLYNNTGTLTLNDGTSNVSTYAHTHGTSKTLTLTGNVWNYSSTLTEFKLGIKATDTTTGLTYYFPNSSTTTLQITGIADQTLTFDAEWLTCNGTYEIRMVGRNVNSTSNADWYEVGTTSSVTIPTVTVTNAAETFTKSDVTAQISATNLYVGQTAQITTGGYDGTLTYSSTDESVATVANGVVTAVGEGTATITVNAPATDYYNNTTATFTVTVTEADGLTFTEAPYFSNDNNPWENDLTLHMTLFNGTESTFNNYIYAVIEMNGGSLKYGYPVNLASKVTQSFEMDLAGYKNYMAANTQKTISFYQDADCTIPFNIPSITYTYRSTLNYDYDLSSANIGTLILPFDAEIPTKTKNGDAFPLKAYECNSMNGDALELKEATTLKRNTPYIIEGEVAATYTFTGPNAVDASPVLFGTGYLKGTMLTDKYEFTTADYILQNQDAGIAFYHHATDNDGWYAAPYRAFINTGSTLSLSYVAIPGITQGIATGISTVTGTTKAAGIYSANGVKLSRLQSGLNIIIDEQGNTTKVFIKK